MTKRVREGARVLLVTPEKKFLLFHFVYKDGPLRGTDYWGIPGGGVDPGETPEDAARRELHEETGLSVDDVGGLRDVVTYDLRLMSGEDVSQKDYLFLVRVPEEFALSREFFTPEEKVSLAEARWWTLTELRRTRDTVKPPVILPMVQRVLLDEKP